jgi:phosphoserine phosphatase RsbU/P
MTASPTGGTTTDIGRASLPPVTDSLVLVVDDIEWNRALIGTLLEEAGYTRINYAANGEEALTSIALETPDLVILDIMMPGLDGFEVCRRLRANHAYANLPILVQTSLSGVEDRNRAFEAGTTDLVTKPLDRTELLARVGIHLQNRALIRSLQTYRDRLEGELDMARGLFEHLLPTEAAVAGLMRASGVVLVSHVLRASDLGGDIWGTVPLEGGRFGVYLLDMAGRGVSAALNVCRLHTLCQELVALAGSPAGFLSELNHRTHDLLSRGEFASMVYGVISPDTDRFTYACAAANPPLLLLPDTLAAPLDQAAGLPLGILANAPFAECVIPFPRGAAILITSNAILDVLDERKGSGGASCLADLVAPLWSARQGAAAFPAIFETLDRLVGNPPKDDHTLVWLSR